MGISTGFAKIFDLIFLILIITILLSWFPGINWAKEPYRTLKIFSEIFLSPFRKFIPPIGYIDISPIIAFICLNILKEVIVGSLRNIGL